MPLTTDDRLAAVEADVSQIKAAVEQLSSGQTAARAEVRAEGEIQRHLIAAAAADAATKFATQNASLLQLSQTVNRVQTNIQQWAAGGALLGAVLLFIAVRALGF